MLLSLIGAPLQDVIYGVNTGYGGNANLVIPEEEVAHHQANL